LESNRTFFDHPFGHPILRDLSQQENGNVLQAGQALQPA
jgi:hypothetical protein